MLSVPRRPSKSTSAAEPAERDTGLSWNIPGQSVVPGTRAKVVITWINDPNSFYVQEIDDYSTLLNMQRDIQSYVCSKENGMNQFLTTPPYVGKPVLSLNPATETDEWYRAEITHVAGPRIQVLFVDYGSISMVSKNNIRPIPPQFVVQPPLTMMHCSLRKIQPPSVVWQSKTITAMKERCFNNECEIVVGGFSQGYHMVDVFVDGNDFGLELVKAGLAKKRVTYDYRLSEFAPSMENGDSRPVHLDEKSDPADGQVASSSSSCESGETVDASSDLSTDSSTNEYDNLFLHEAPVYVPTQQVTYAPASGIQKQSDSDASKAKKNRTERLKTMLVMMSNEIAELKEIQKTAAERIVVLERVCGQAVADISALVESENDEEESRITPSANMPRNAMMPHPGKYRF